MRFKKIILFILIFLYLFLFFIFIFALEKVTVLALFSLLVVFSILTGFRAKNKDRRFLFLNSLICVILCFFVVIIQFFVVEKFVVPTSSMEPTLKLGEFSGDPFGSDYYEKVKSDRVLILKMFVSQPSRGDLIAFREPKYRDKLYIKRCIGLPGEEIQVKNGKVCINGKEIDEPYLNQKNLKSDLIPDFPPRKNDTEVFDSQFPKSMIGHVVETAVGNAFKILKGHYFLLGDNRSNSLDSRFLGPIPEDLILGKAVLIYWPLNRIQFLKSYFNDPN